MNVASYRAQVIQLYIDLPDTPEDASSNDWAVAADLDRRTVPLETVAHALRLATLRRFANDAAFSPGLVNSLAYYRRVIANLTPDELHPDYVAYVEERFRRLMQPQPEEERSESRIPALLDSR